MHLSTGQCTATRRHLLRSAAVGGGVIAAATVLPNVAQAAAGTGAAVIGKHSFCSRRRR